MPALALSLFLTPQVARGAPDPIIFAAEDSAGEYVLTLSAECMLTSFRLPGLARIGTFDGGECDAAGIAPAPEGHALVVVTRSGALMTLTMPELKVMTRSRQNLVATAMLVPASGHHLIIVDAKSRQLHILNRETLALLRSVAMRDRRGQPLTFARMIESVARRSVLIAFAESELWEMFLAPDAEPVFEGLVHDYRMGEGLRDESILPIRRIALDAPMENLSLDPGSAYLVAAQRVNDGSTRLLRFNLDVRRAVAERRVARMPVALAVVSPPGGKGRRLLVSDREGIRGYSLPGLVPESDIDVSADDCGIAAADDARWLALSDCRGDAPGRVHIVDLITNSPKAILQPFGEMMPGEVISRRPDGSLWFAGYGPAGAVIRYRSGDWCRASELVLPGLKRAWIYP